MKVLKKYTSLPLRVIRKIKGWAITEACSPFEMQAKERAELLVVLQELVEVNLELGFSQSKTAYKLDCLLASLSEPSSSSENGYWLVPDNVEKFSKVDDLILQEETFQYFPLMKGAKRARLLNVGNIANVAYNNNKLQQAAGWDSTLLSYDFYHIMSSPEWEDAEFDTPPANQYYPDWWGVNFRMPYQRPDWFIQGPAELAIEFLVAKNTNYSWLENLAHKTERGRWMACSDSLTAKKIREIITARPEIAPAVSRVVDECVDNAASKVLCYEDVAEDFRRCFPHDKREITVDDYYAYSLHLKRWARLFDQYDLVTGYATDPILPYLCGKRPYVALEIGTVRDLPFEDTSTGKMLALAYRNADLVFVTNSDVLPQLKKLGIPTCRQVFLPHPFNDDKIKRFINSRISTIPSFPTKAPFYFFHPSRHHWREGISSMLKGNHLVFAAVKLLKEKGYHFSVTLIEWGEDVARSRLRIAELGVEDFFSWVPPMRKQQLWAEYIRSNAVIDQFVLPALGNVGLEALCLGRPLISNIDSEACAAFFGECPPVLRAVNEYDIASHMERLMTRPQYTSEVGAAGQEWFERWHSADRILSLMNKGCQQLLESEGIKGSYGKA
ncbi:hypothetical protein ACQKIK_01160 [Pseudomonas sp. NPDC047961]